MAPNSGHRMGGRNARKAKRAAALPDNMKPVHPGQEGGNFKPLKEEDLPKIHEAVLQVLETIGMDKAIPSCIEACTAIGCTVSSEGRLLFPRSVVKDGLAKAGRDITLFGASPEHEPGGPVMIPSPDWCRAVLLSHQSHAKCVAGGDFSPQRAQRSLG